MCVHPCACVRIHTHVSVCTHCVCVHTCVNVQVHRCARLHTLCVCVCGYTCVCVCACMCVCIHVSACGQCVRRWVRVQVYTCVCLCVCLCTHACACVCKHIMFMASNKSTSCLTGGSVDLHPYTSPGFHARPESARGRGHNVLPAASGPSLGAQWDCASSSHVVRDGNLLTRSWEQELRATSPWGHLISQEGPSQASRP